MRYRLALPVIAILLLSTWPARADVTGFIGVNGSPASRLVKGGAISATLVIVGAEFEYAQTSEDPASLAPALRTGSGNLLVQSPISVAGLQVYGTVGATVYRETLGPHAETNVGVNTGGGVKLKLVGPLKARVDYRVFKLRGDAVASVVHRFYVGGVLGF